MFEARDILWLPEPELRGLRGHRLSMVVPNPRGELNPVLTVGEQIANMARIHLGVGQAEARSWRSTCCARCRSPTPNGG